MYLSKATRRNGRGIGRWLCGMMSAILYISLFSSCSEDTPSSPPGESDIYAGSASELFLGMETEGLQAEDCELCILTPDGNVIRRTCEHHRNGGKSKLKMNVGLKEGSYHLLYIEYPAEESVIAESEGKITTRQLGLGSRIEVDSRSMTVSSSYDPEMGLSGSGTRTDPYIISSYDHMRTLAHKVNSDVTNYLFGDSTHFSQIADIDMDDACFYTDHRYGWNPIGSDCNLPFRGCYHGNGKRLSHIWSQRGNSTSVGLFGNILNANIDGVVIDSSEFEGNFAVGGVAGAVISRGGKKDRSTIAECRVENSTVTGSEGSVAIGGVVGVVDAHSQIVLYKCENLGSGVSGDYNVGGILGAGLYYTLSSVNSCKNSGRVTAGYSGAGGIAGTTDTLYVTACENLGMIQGGARYRSGDASNAAIGTGGIAGGTGMAFVTGCANSGAVKGVEGVGGMLGSNRVRSADNGGFIFNNAVFRYCSNTGGVEGVSSVGGICGESQFGCFGVINRGAVKGTRYIGGVAGNTSVAVAHNAINTGAVDGHDYVAGIVAKTTFGSIALNDNYGRITADGSHTSGIAGLAGNNTIIHYCGNHGDIVNTSGKYIGGIVGEIGDPREWTGWNIAECVVGSVEIVMAVLGPCIAVAEHAVAGAAHAAGIAIKISELSFDMLLHATDGVLWSYTTYEMANGETKEEVSACISGMTYDLANSINDEMGAIRRSSDNYQTGDLSVTPLCSGYGVYSTDHIGWYSTGENDETFNDMINETREERMEAEEKMHRASEILHQVIGGVCLVAGTVAAIGAVVASGGMATAFVVAGSAVAVVGGANAIEKSCMEFESNAVVISQCVNSGSIKANGEAGGIAGSIHDSSIIRDCLNAGKGTGKEHTFAAHYGKWAGVQRGICAGNADTEWNCNGVGTCPGSSAVVRKGNQPSGGSAQPGNLYYVGSSDLCNRNIYLSADNSWDISNQAASRWIIPDKGSDGIYYPVPAFSEMRASK